MIDIAPNDGRLVRDCPLGEPPQKQDGWIGCAYWKKVGLAVIEYFKSTWRVPPLPTEDHAQTQFLFESIESNGSNAILLPALQYGISAAGGGSYWAVASWYQVGSQTYYTTPVEVSAGDLLVGRIESTIYSTGAVDYHASFANITDESRLAVCNAEELISITVTAVSYNVKLSNSPTWSTVVFYPFHMSHSDGPIAVLPWLPVEGTNGMASVTGDTGPLITVFYPN